MNKITKKTVFVWTTALGLTFSSMGMVSASSINDIKGHWAEGVITSWNERDLVSGYEDGTFRPEDKVNREEFTALVNRSFGLMGAQTVGFADVKQTDWSYEDIGVAKKAGYVSGYPDGTFRPKNEMTRQEVAVIIANLLDLNQSGTVESLADGKGIAAWSKRAISAVIDNEIMAGYPNGTFGPVRSTTRAEAIAIIDKALFFKTQRDHLAPGPALVTTPAPTTPNTNSTIPTNAK
ncbi:S-layer homology domain-containing protein [Paenibacillus macquariensis]|uniref:S-layer homology domain-containing protein n=1 Tax=Paenibacillus macquariensis TaxID=948756 RepID=A0ABY1K4K0_9BACL|nr:S-layer homology domain-containing protein [Paenibacillus macquariensis]MEC0089010.1 S-layer homology domain-containing protein [Paenibacillus macquariensis]OAB31854.1 hypothetical protein PMSM_18640 [Paenibacillus macquariensis subsp. macquariensis]SIR24411.1 S-layer homology domain-containing protein [Paenibacillus macquariensis]